MGCDIHIYPEYYSKKSLIEEPERLWVSSICGEYQIGRSYDLFGIMCHGVRSNNPNSIDNARGLPDDPNMGYLAKSRSQLVVIPDHELKSSCAPEGFIAESLVDNWRKTGSKILTINPASETDREVIQNPDYHSHSWLTTQELFKVRQLYLNDQIRYQHEQYDLKKKQVREYIKILNSTSDPIQLLNYNFGLFEYPSLNGLIGMLYTIERSDPDLVGRIVFWFDS